MFSYYLRLAWLSIRQSSGLSLLMVLAIGLGIGAAMTTITCELFNVGRSDSGQK